MAKKREEKEREVQKKPFYLIAGFLVMMMVGIAAGEVGRVLEQAVRVCLSCIGIG